MSVLTEIKSALVVLVILHATAFVVMVGYRMHTKQYYISEAAKEARVVRVTPKPKTNATIDNPLEAFEARVRLLSQSVLEAQKSIDSYIQEAGQQMDLLNSLEQDIEQLFEATEKEEEIEGSDPDPESALSHWRDFLSVGSLRDIPNEELQEFFDNATKDIKMIVGGNNQLAKQFLSDTNRGAKTIKEPREFVCPLAPPGLLAKDDDKAVPVVRTRKRPRQVGAAYESDLEAYLEKFETKFGNRIQANGVHALLPRSVESAESVLEEQFNLVLDDIYELADDLEKLVEEGGASRSTVASSSSSCEIDPELVASLVSAGLDAQMARADVQEALRRSILEHDPSVSVDDLILDADLGGGGTCGGSPGLKSFNLRTTIDTPLLIKSIEWIDVLVDAVGGYNDVVDQYLDSLTGFHGTTSVGEIVVEGILEKAGKVGDIHVEKYLEKAQDVIQSITGKK